MPSEFLVENLGFNFDPRKRSVTSGIGLARRSTIEIASVSTAPVVEDGKIDGGQLNVEIWFGAVDDPQQLKGGSAKFDFYLLWLLSQRDLVQLSLIFFLTVLPASSACVRSSSEVWKLTSTFAATFMLLRITCCWNLERGI